MRSVALLCLVLSVGVFAQFTTKYAENYVGQIREPTASPYTIVDGTTPLQGPTGTQPDSALEWFLYRGPTTAGCYILWSTSTTACGVLPVATDDVVLGRGIQSEGVPGTTPFTSGTPFTSIASSTANTQSLFFSFNSPRLRCATTAPTINACRGMDTRDATVTPPTNAEIHSLTLWAGRAGALATTNAVTSTLGAIIFTGYPVPGTGVYAPDAATWSITGSSRLKVQTSINLRQTNTALYGSGFGVSLGGVSAGSNGDFGTAAFSADSAYGVTTRGGARNALSGSDANAITWFTTAGNAAAIAAQANKTGYGFVIETAAILVDPCGYSQDAAVRCTGGFAASEIQGPNLYIQPLSSAGVTDPVVIQNSTTPSTLTNSTALHVNITITAQSILFTTSTVYINAVFTVQSGGALAFCEPVQRTTATTVNGFGNQVIAAGGSIPAAAGVSGISFSTPSGQAVFPSRDWCSPVGSNAYDWFGPSFTSVRIINQNPGGTSVFWSPVAPAVAKLAVVYGPYYTIPVSGNVTIASSAAGTVTSPVSLLDAQVYLLETETAPTTAGTILTASPRFVGMKVPTSPTQIAQVSYVTTYDCSAYGRVGTGGGAAPAADPAASQSIRAQAGAQCQGHPIPSRFTFFGGVVTIAGGAATRQPFKLTDYDLLVAGDGNGNSTMNATSTITFQGSFHLCGTFSARANGVFNFPAEVVSGGLAFGGQGNVATVGNYGQPLTDYATVARSPATTGAITAASTAQPTPDFLTPTPGLAHNSSLAPLVPVGPVPTATCQPLRITGFTAGSACFPGTYSYLFTAAPTATASDTVRPYVVQVYCTNGVCGGANEVVMVDPGCYVTPASAGTVVVPPASYGYVRGRCNGAQTAVTLAGVTAGAYQVPTTCTKTSFTGLLPFPSSQQSNVSVGLVQLAKASTIEGRNVSFLATTVRATADITVTDVLDRSNVNATDSTLVPSTLSVGSLATLNVAGGVLSTDSLSSLTIQGDGFLTLTDAGVMGTGTFVVNGAATFASATGTVNSGTGRTVLTGTGLVTFSGTTEIITSSAANTGVISQVPTLVNGTLDIQGQYSQTVRNITVSGAIGTTAAGRLTLSTGASLILNNGSLSSANLGNSQVFQITLGDATSQVIVPANSTATVTNPAVIRSVNTTTVGLVVEGTLQSASTVQLGSVSLVLATNALVTGTLGGASSTVEVGTPTGVNHTVTLSGNATIAGTFRLYPNSQIINSGSASVAANTAVEYVAGSSPTNITALVNSGTLVLAGAFSPNVNIINTGSINSTGTLTIPAGRTLRLQGGSVFGSQVVINGAVTVESGTNSLLAGAVVNNGVITVNAPATLILTACLTGTGSLVGSGTVIYQGQTGCSVNGNFGGSLVLQGNSTANSGLTIITGFISGNGTIVAGSGYLSINNVNASSSASLAFSGTPTVGAASAINVLTVSGSVNVNTTAAAGSSLTLGQAVVGIRDPVTFVINSNGIVFTLTSGQINLLSSLLVPAGALFRTAGTVVGGSVQVIGALQLAGSTTFTNTNVTVVAGGKVNSTATTNQLILSSGSSLFVNANATFGGFVVTVNQGANFTFGGNFTGATVVNGAGRIFLASNVVVPAGATVTFNGLVVCAPGVVVSTVGSGSVNFVASYSGCTVSGNVQGSPVAGGAAGVITFIGGNIVLVAGTQLSPSLRIPANTTLIVQPGTNITCPTAALGQQCWIVVSGGGNLTLPFYPVCSNGNIPNFRNISGSCGNGIASSFVAGVGVVLYFGEGDASTGLLAVFYMVSGNANNQTLTTQDLPTYPIGTVDQLVLTATAHTVVVTTGNNLNPLIVRNRLVLGGLLEVRTLTFVPLRPVVIMRLANYNSTNMITGAFSRVVVTHDQSRSSHNFAWNVGFPTVRVVANDVILDPNGNGNSAAGVVPSFVVALFAVLAAFLFRN